MKRKVLILTMLLLLVSTAFQVYPNPALVLKMQDGTKQNLNLSHIQKLTFKGGYMKVSYKNGTTDSVSLSNITRFTFDNTSPNISGNNLEWIFPSKGVFPNPAQDVLYVNAAITKKTNVYIYRTDGSMALTTMISSDGEAINISSLNKGLYLLIVNNEAFKFLKL